MSNPTIYSKIKYPEYEKKIPKTFKSDGCTLFPDGKDYKSCCVMHDHARKNEKVSDRHADKMFFECMKDRSNIFLACITWLFVRLQSISGLSPVSFAMISMVIGFIIWMLNHA